MNPLTPPKEITLPLIQGGTYSSVLGTSVGVASAGIKGTERLDVAVLRAEGPAAAVTTVSTAAAACCRWTRERLPGMLRAVVVNSGNANAATGLQGEKDCFRMAEETARALGCDTNEIAVCSTGVIGVPMPMDRVLPGIREAATQMTASGSDAAQAILTTDLRTKEASCSAAGITVGGIAKGSGMIHPNMATMLGFLATDAIVEPSLLQTLLEDTVNRTFNCITVDGDMSTSDTVILQTTGQGVVVEPDTAEWDILTQALYSVCRHLAREIARDGEGANRLVEVLVEGLTDEEARVAAKGVIRSPLVKTAIHGCDANWGRVVGALGAYQVPHLEELSLDFAGIPVVRDGMPVPFNETLATANLSQDEVLIHVRLPGDGIGRAWGCDLSADYVRINADYRS